MNFRNFLNIFLNFAPKPKKFSAFKDISIFEYLEK